MSNCKVAAYISRCMLSRSLVDQCSLAFALLALSPASFPEEKFMRVWQEGAGDDASSWGVCWHRQGKWHVGDVVGSALDMSIADHAFMSVSVNSSFAFPNGVAFSSIDTCSAACTVRQRQMPV